jgi:hypothetical protein
MSDTTQTPSDATPAVDAEMEVANSGPAILSNRFFVTLGQSGIRIAFTEQIAPEKPSAFRTAVALSFQDGIALYKLLQVVLKEVEENIEKVTSEQKEDSSNG